MVASAHQRPDALGQARVLTGLDAWHPSSGRDLSGSDWMDAGSHPARMAPDAAEMNAT